MLTLNGNIKDVWTKWRTDDLVIDDLMTWWLDNYHVNFWTSKFWSVDESVIDPVMQTLTHELMNQLMNE